MTPTTTDRDPDPTLAAPCRRCRTTGGAIDKRNGRPTRRRRMCAACYKHEYAHGDITQYPTTWEGPTIDNLPAGIVTPAMLGITPGRIAARCHTAQAQLWADEAACILAGAQWRQRHPEQFAPDHLARIFGGSATHAFWREDAAAAA